MRLFPYSGDTLPIVFDDFLPLRNHKTVPDFIIITQLLLSENLL